MGQSRGLRTVLFTFAAEMRVPHPFASFAKGWETMRPAVPVFLAPPGRY